jgi:hypothetical protein
MHSASFDIIEHLDSLNQKSIKYWEAYNAVYNQLLGKYGFPSNDRQPKNYETFIVSDAYFAIWHFSNFHIYFESNNWLSIEYFSDSWKDYYKEYDNYKPPEQPKNFSL